MANRHFAKFADVWKHLPLVEILAIERPDAYWESHAGSATYEMTDDPERRYGVRHVVAASREYPALGSSRYLAQIDALNSSHETLVGYPGSAQLAMMELGSSCAYLFCDLDPESVADLGAASERLNLADRVDVRQADGMTSLRRAAQSVGRGERVVAHVDPYDPWASIPDGPSALEVAAEVMSAGLGLVYWYGYDRPDERAWAFDELRQRAPAVPLWCGDMMVTTDGRVRSDGDLGAATTPGTGCGVVCANLSPAAIAACERLGDDLVAAYEGVPLPDGDPGAIDLLCQGGSPTT